MTRNAFVLTPQRLGDPDRVMQVSHRAHKLEVDGAVEILQIGDKMAPGSYEVVIVNVDDPRQARQLLEA